MPTQNLQTAAGARAAFLQLIQSFDGLDGVLEDAIEPSELNDGIFVTLQEGGDIPLDTLMGGETPRYEVFSIVHLDVISRHEDKAKEASIRAMVIAACEADPFLGGALDDIRIVTASNETDGPAGAEKIRATSIGIELHYTSTSPVG